MARVVADEQLVDRTGIIWGKTVAVGAGLGLVFWLLTLLLGHYVIEPLACRDVATASSCVGATSLAGNVAAIMTAAIGVLVLVRMGIHRPIIVALATLALLWSLATLTTGLFWGEIVLWSVLLYALSYGLFAWIARTARLWLALVLSIVVILLIRITLMV